MLPGARSPPLRNVSFSPGGRGTRRGHRLGWSLGFPGDFGKESSCRAVPAPGPRKMGSGESILDNDLRCGAKAVLFSGARARKGIWPSTSVRLDLVEPGPVASASAESTPSKLLHAPRSVPPAGRFVLDRH